MRGRRLVIALSGVVLLAQVLHHSPLIDVAAGAPPEGVGLHYPLLHVLLAPFTLVADWLNGGSTADLIGFAAWSLILYLLARLFSAAPRSLARELSYAAAFLVLFGCYIWWGARWPRPIPRLSATDSLLVVFDSHSHTSASHDGRSGFGVAANAAWHRRAGFDAAFVTDHNVFGAARQWQRDRGAQTPRLLNGEELSLSGLHMIVLGNDNAIANTPWNASFDSSLALLHALHPPKDGGAASSAPLVVASLPEYWRHHWGPDLGRVVASGVEGLEIWTTSPRAMDFPPPLRREAVARGRSLGMALLGATDMHGLGQTASVWNVVSLPGWRAMDDEALARALLQALRIRPADVHVVALRRRLADTRGAQIAGMPLGLFEVLRGASRAHGAALLAWLWLPGLLASRRRRPASG